MSEHICADCGYRPATDDGLCSTCAAREARENAAQAALFDLDADGRAEAEADMARLFEEYVKQWKNDPCPERK